MDHCSVSWSSDEGLSVIQLPPPEQPVEPGKRPAITICNNIIADGLQYCELTPKGSHNKGSILYQGFAHYVMGNLYANMNCRTPNLGGSVFGNKGGVDAAIVNTLIHGKLAKYYTIATSPAGWRRLAVIGNKFSTYEIRGYDFGRGIGRGGFDRQLENDKAPKEVYLADNEYTEIKDIEWWDIVDKPPIDLHAIKPLPREDVIAHAIRTVGARPAERTPLDERVIRQVREGWGEEIDSQEDVGGYPRIEFTRRALDVPDDPVTLGQWLYKHTMAVEIPGAKPPASR